MAHAPLLLAAAYQLPFTRTERLAAGSLTVPPIAGVGSLVVNELTATVKGGAT